MTLKFKILIYSLLILIIFLSIFYIAKLKKHEEEFILQSLKGLITSLAVTSKDDTSINLIDFDTKSGLISFSVFIKIPVNFKLNEAKDYIKGYFSKNHYKVSFLKDKRIKLKSRTGFNFYIDFTAPEPLGVVFLVLDINQKKLVDIYKFLDLGIPITFAINPDHKLLKEIVIILDKKHYKYILKDSGHYKEYLKKALTIDTKNNIDYISQKFEDAKDIALKGAPVSLIGRISTDNLVFAIKDILPNYNEAKVKFEEEL